MLRFPKPEKLFEKVYNASSKKVERLLKILSRTW